MKNRFLTVNIILADRLGNKEAVDLGKMFIEIQLLNLKRVDGRPLKFSEPMVVTGRLASGASWLGPRTLIPKRSIRS